MTCKQRCFLVCISSLFLLISCSNPPEDEIPKHIKDLENLTVYPTDPVPQMEMELSREQTFGSTEQILISSIGGIDADKQGRVFLADPHKHTIHVFRPDGSYITSIGREGHGPGEFISTPLPSIKSNKLYLYDFIQLKMNIYSLDSLALINEFNLNSISQENNRELAGYHLQKVIVSSESTFLVGYESLNTTPPTRPGQQIDQRILYYKMNNKGRIVSDLLLEQKGKIWLTGRIESRIQMATNFPFLGKSLIRLSKSGQIFSAWSDDFLIKVRDSNGRYLRAFYYPKRKSVLNPEEIPHKRNMPSSAIKYRHRILQQNNLPETWPALETMFFDDENRLWVSTIVDNMNIYEWWVLKESGETITKFRWPKDKPIEVVNNGYMYTRETNEVTRLEEIVRYKIEMQPN